MSKGESKEYRTRLKEITSVLHKYGITRGITPQKLRMILEDLGPTYIKIGQIMSLHSDILPKRYCDELMCLRSEVTPMEFPEVKEVIEQAYGCPWNEIFAFISDTPLGSASIAQVHRAELLSGEQVVIKVQRTGIYEIMARDIGLLRKAVKLMPPISLKGMADFDQVLDELWNVTREEMNFLTEASNMEEFARRNADVVYVRTPKLYQEYTTMHVLVMEYIEGPAVWSGCFVPVSSFFFASAAFSSSVRVFLNGSFPRSPKNLQHTKIYQSPPRTIINAAILKHGANPSTPSFANTSLYRIPTRNVPMNAPTFTSV